MNIRILTHQNFNFNQILEKYFPKQLRLFRLAQFYLDSLIQTFCLPSTKPLKVFNKENVLISVSLRRWSTKPHYFKLDYLQAKEVGAPKPMYLSEVTYYFKGNTIERERTRDWYNSKIQSNPNIRVVVGAEEISKTVNPSERLSGSGDVKKFDQILKEASAHNKWDEKNTI